MPSNIVPGGATVRLGLAAGVERTGVRVGVLEKVDVREGVGRSRVTVAVGSGGRNERGVAITAGVSVGVGTSTRTVAVGEGVSPEP